MVELTQISLHPMEAQWRVWMHLYKEPRVSQEGWHPEVQGFPSISVRLRPAVRDGRQRPLTQTPSIMRHPWGKDHSSDPGEAAGSGGEKRDLDSLPRS